MMTMHPLPKSSKRIFSVAPPIIASIRFATVFTSYPCSENQFINVGIKTLNERFLTNTCLADIFLEASVSEKLHYSVNKGSNYFLQGLSVCNHRGYWGTDSVIRKHHDPSCSTLQHSAVSKSSQNIKLASRWCPIRRCCYKTARLLWRGRHMLFTVNLFSYHFSTHGANVLTTYCTLACHLTYWFLSSAHITNVIWFLNYTHWTTPELNEI